MSELIKTLNLLIVKTQVNDSDIACEVFTLNTDLLPCYLPSTGNVSTRKCELCALNSNTEAKPIVKILSKFHE